MKALIIFAVLLSLLLLLCGCVSSPSSSGPQVQNGTLTADGKITSDGLTISTNTTAAQGTQVVPILPAATSGQVYNALISVTGGSGPYGCYPAPGTTLPGQLVFSEPGCSISGTAPTLSSGTPSAVYPLSFIVMDSTGKVAGPITFNLIVTQPAASQLLFAAETLPNGAVGQPYSHSFISEGSPPNPSGGQPPYHFVLNSGVGFPPMGLILNPDGTLTGTPSAAGTSTFSVCAVDQSGDQKCATEELTVGGTSGLAGVWSGPAHFTDYPDSQGGQCGYDGTFTLSITQVGINITAAEQIYVTRATLLQSSNFHVACAANPNSPWSWGTFTGTASSSKIILIPYSGSSSINGDYTADLRTMNLNFDFPEQGKGTAQLTRQN